MISEFVFVTVITDKIAVLYVQNMSLSNDINF